MEQSILLSFNNILVHYIYMLLIYQFVKMYLLIILLLIIQFSLTLVIKLIYKIQFYIQGKDGIDS